jgi:hypothetical protein
MILWVETDDIQYLPHAFYKPGLSQEYRAFRYVGTIIGFVGQTAMMNIGHLLVDGCQSSRTHSIEKEGEGK